MIANGDAMRIPQDKLRELFEYDPLTGHVTYKARGYKHFKDVDAWQEWNQKYAGKRAGNISIRKSDGYRRRLISVRGTPRGEHRIIWALMKGYPLPKQIDHINNDATDNRWENLRDGTGINQRNKSKSRNNTSGYTGVTKCPVTGKWRAQCGFKRKTHYLGVYADKEEAARVVMDFRASKGFSETHGINYAPR